MGERRKRGKKRRGDGGSLEGIYATGKGWHMLIFELKRCVVIGRRFKKKAKKKRLLSCIFTDESDRRYTNMNESKM